jgi:hypothetical protein
MAHVGTASVQIVPDLSGFTRLMETALAASGIVVREETTYEHDDSGLVVRQIVTTSVNRAD